MRILSLSLSTLLASWCFDAKADIGPWGKDNNPPFHCPDPSNIKLEDIKTIKEKGEIFLYAQRKDKNDETHVIFKPKDMKEIQAIGTKNPVSRFEKTLKLVEDKFENGMKKCTYGYTGASTRTKTFTLTAPMYQMEVDEGKY